MAPSNSPAAFRAAARDAVAGLRGFAAVAGKPGYATVDAVAGRAVDEVIAPAARGWADSSERARFLTEVVGAARAEILALPVSDVLRTRFYTDLANRVGRMAGNERS